MVTDTILTDVQESRPATEHVRCCAMIDPAAAAEATGTAVADTLHVVARALRSPHLRRAADSYTAA